MSDPWRPLLSRPAEGPSAEPAPNEPMPINRRPSRVVALATPWLATMGGSLAASLLWIASAPIVPPLGLLVLIAWCQLRPRLLPLWAGLPLGGFDDLYSGQPLGSAILTWSLVLLALDALETRIPWRGLALEWLIAASLIAAVVLLALGIVTVVAGDMASARLVAPQIGLAALAYPPIARLVAACDRIRLVPFVSVRT